MSKQHWKNDNYSLTIMDDTEIPSKEQLEARETMEAIQTYILSEGVLTNFPPESIGYAKEQEFIECVIKRENIGLGRMQQIIGEIISNRYEKQIRNEVEKQ